MLYGGSAGGGKALNVETPIPTPDGWSTMGQLLPGDTVFAENGSQYSVTACSEVMVGRPCYEVEFSDGAKFVADAGHLWVTLTNADRNALWHRTDEFKARRRDTRAKRGTGKKPWLAKLNSERRMVTKTAPVPTPKTTEQIANSLRDGNHINHSVAVCGPLSIAAAELPIDPYVLGVWLGDGTSAGGGFTSADAEIVEAVGAAGYPVREKMDKYGWGTHGLCTRLRVAGLISNKHIPAAYLRGSFAQRLALLQGLMDTDGCCSDEDGGCEFTTTSPALRDGITELLATLGIKASARQGIAKLYGRAIGPKWRLLFLCDLPVFRLTRKLNRQKRDDFRGTHQRRYIVGCRQVESVPVRCIAVDSPSRCFLVGREMVPTHNSVALLAGALQYVDRPGYSALMLRRTFADLNKPYALIPMSHDWLQGTGAKWNDNEHQWTFPSGATLSFGYLANENDKYQFQGAAYHGVFWDELTQFTETQYRYLFSRRRKAVGDTIPMRFRASSNPGGVGHEWVKQRFIVEAGERRKFIPARLEDNPYLDQADYEQSLAELDYVTRAQLRHGDWDVRQEGSLFKREWFNDKIVEAAPLLKRRLRFWDLAATEADEKNPDPDYTAGCLMGLADAGLFYVLDAQEFRETPAKVQARIVAAAQMDGHGVEVHIEQEPGASGKSMIDHYRREVLRGYAVYGVRSSGDKLTRAKPFSAACENGLVRLVRGNWLTMWIDRLASFGQPGAHDDSTDAASSAHKGLSRAAVTIKGAPVLIAGSNSTTPG